MKFHVRRAAVRGVAAAVLAAIGAEAAAVQVYVQPVVYMREEMDDNVALAVEDETSLVGTTVGTLVKSGLREELWHVDLDVGANSSHFNRKEYDYDGQNIKMAGAYESETDQFDASVGLVRDSTRDSEVLDTGNIGTAAMRREMTDAAGSWRHFVSERQLLEVAPSLTRMRYDTDTLNDFDQDVVSLGWIYLFSERSRLTGSVYRENLSYQVLHGPESETTGVQVRVDHQFSETEKVSAFLGRAATDTDGETDVGVFDWRLIDPPGPEPLGVYKVKVASLYVPYSSSKNTTRMGVDYTWEMDLLSGTLSLSQNTRASGNGYIMQYQGLQADLRYDMSPRQYVSGSLVAQTQKALDDQRYTVDRNIYEANFFYVYKLTETWTVDFNYRYRLEKEKSVGRGVSNALLISIRYVPTEQTWGW